MRDARKGQVGCHLGCQFQQSLKTAQYLLFPSASLVSVFLGVRDNNPNLLLKLVEGGCLSFITQRVFINVFGNEPSIWLQEDIKPWLLENEFQLEARWCQLQLWNFKTKAGRQGHPGISKVSVTSFKQYCLEKCFIPQGVHTKPYLWLMTKATMCRT